MPARKVPCELKRGYHPDLWTAADKQLEALYSREPESKGFGVYGVFWFGDKLPVPIPKHPDGLSRPHSAAELEQMLRDRIPADRRNRLNVQRHLTSASTHRGFRAAATNIWRATVEVAQGLAGTLVPCVPPPQPDQAPPPHEHNPAASPAVY